MTNKEKFKEVFGVELGESLDFDTSCAYISQIVALRSMYIKGVDCICEWLNSEYIDNAPTVEEKHKGEWQITKAGYVKCPYCRCEREIPENFCGYCGAEILRGDKK